MNATCSITTCTKVVLARGWCKSHYQRWQRHGDPLGGRTTAPGEARAYFFSQLERQTDECFVWPYGKMASGYGVAHVDGRRNTVHHLACRIVYGPPPPGMEAAHSCRSRQCFNPRHLRWATSRENKADRHRDGTAPQGETVNGAKLTNAAVADIRRRYAEGLVTQRQLSEEYGVRRKTITNVVNRKTWAHM